MATRERVTSGATGRREAPQDNQNGSFFIRDGKIYVDETKVNQLQARVLRGLLIAGATLPLAAAAAKIIFR